MHGRWRRNVSCVHTVFREFVYTTLLARATYVWLFPVSTLIIAPPNRVLLFFFFNYFIPYLQIRQPEVKSYPSEMAWTAWKLLHHKFSQRPKINAVKFFLSQVCVHSLGAIKNSSTQKQNIGLPTTNSDHPNHWNESSGVSALSNSRFVTYWVGFYGVLLTKN